MPDFEQLRFAPERIVDDLLSRVDLSRPEVRANCEYLISIGESDDTGAEPVAGWFGTSLHGMLVALQTAEFPPARMQDRRNEGHAGLYFNPSQWTLQQFSQQTFEAEVPVDDESAWKRAITFGRGISQQDHLLHSLGVDLGDIEICSQADRAFGEGPEELLAVLQQRGVRISEQALRNLIATIDPLPGTKPRITGSVVMTLGNKVLKEREVKPAVGKDEGFRVMGPVALEDNVNFYAVGDMELRFVNRLAEKLSRA